VAETGRYMYAISRRVDPALLTEQQGLDGGRLEMVQHRDLCAVVSDVDLDEYGEEGLRRNLERLDWLEATARRHDAVVQAVSVRGPTAPMRLATICLDDDAVRRRLDEWYAALEQVLDRVEGRMEWSVKVIVAATATPPGTPEAELPASGGGAAYLQRKKAQSEARQRVEEQAVQVADEAHAALSARSVASRRLPAQDPRLTGHQGTMVLNGAYLVGVDEGAPFEAVVRSLTTAHPDAQIEARGPWPPYSFAMLEQE
jgi:Gas vesicle synthesis protein GvpL/GvpF